MKFYHSFKIEMSGSEEDKQEIRNFIHEQFGEGSVTNVENALSYCLERECETDAFSLAIKIVQTAPELQFKMTGTLNTNEQLEEYVNYDFVYKNHMLELRYSDRYIHFSPNDWESVKEFNKKYEKNYTERDFEIFSEGKWFIAKGDGGYIVNSIPFNKASYASLSQIMDRK